MRTIAVTKQIPVSADAAWAIVRTGADMDRWSPMVTSCRLEGSGQGAVGAAVPEAAALV